MSSASLRPRPDSTSVSKAPPAPVDVTVVTSQACHLCEDALEELAHRTDELTATVVPADTPLGRQLVQRHRPGMFPLVLVDGLFFSSGRLPRRKLDQVLAARARGSVSS
ncbi:MAG: glutaredoxin [Intrasporangium sp.]|uniref:glutaredoxin n=1 Tax=Intrasporangium sp. TaxID=1925024 RepID=UPI002649C6BE|nr:glutaredoxin [Intrasporangium sp.]MDN5796550.1 glutaredoxin [Intrasporangium sp.]